MRRTTISITFLLCMVFCLAACSRNESVKVEAKEETAEKAEEAAVEDDGPLIGIWVSDEGTMEIREDGTGITKKKDKSEEFQWKVKEDTFQVLAGSELTKYNYAVEDDQLVLTQIYENTSKKPSIKFEPVSAFEVKPDNPLVGTWCDEEQHDDDWFYMNLLEDGTGTFELGDEVEELQWKDENDYLIIESETGLKKYSYEFKDYYLILYPEDTTILFERF